MRSATKHATQGIARSIRVQPLTSYKTSVCRYSQRGVPNTSKEVGYLGPGGQLMQQLLDASTSIQKTDNLPSSATVVLHIKTGQDILMRHSNHLAVAAAEAHQRIHQHVLQTNVMHSHWLSSFGSCTVYLKLESEQHTNSFKVRGALNKVLSLSDEQLRQGLVTCSTGNHALAFVYACSRSPAARQAASTIYLPTTASPAKVAKLRAQGGNVVQFGRDCVDAEREARRVAEQQGSTYISPYNDWDIMAGQGTVAVEMLQQLPEGKVDVCIVPVGGGGLIGGIAAVLKAANPECIVIGAQPAASDVMRQSVEAGRIVEAPSDETLSDATAGGIEEGAITLAPCQQYVDHWCTVSEQEIADAMVSLVYHHSKLVEGAAGCGLAAFKKLGTQFRGKTVAIVCCGGNIAVPVLQQVLSMGKVWS